MPLNKATGVFLDAHLHAMGRHLAALDSRVDLDKEIRHQNDEHGFVPEHQYEAYRHDVLAMYEFEKKRQVRSVSSVAAASFAFDRHRGRAGLEEADAALAAELATAR